MAENRPIPSFTNEQLELLTLLRVPQSRRSTCHRIFREASRIIDSLEIFITRGYAYRCSLTHLYELEERMQRLLQHMLIIRAEEEAERAVTRAN